MANDDVYSRKDTISSVDEFNQFEDEEYEQSFIVSIHIKVE